MHATKRSASRLKKLFSSLNYMYSEFFTGRNDIPARIDCFIQTASPPECFTAFGDLGLMFMTVSYTGRSMVSV